MGGRLLQSGLGEGQVVIVSGRLTNGGQPLASTADCKVELVFVPFVEQGEALPTAGRIAPLWTRRASSS